MRLKATIEIEVDDELFGKSDEEKEWLEKEVLTGNGTLLLHSNEIGDTVGVVKSVSNVEYVNQ